MPREIVWLPDAVKDVTRLGTFINEENPAAARQAATRIKQAAQILKNNPEVGKPVDDLAPFRDLLIPFGNGNYVLRYREDQNRVVIVRIRHSREKSF